MTRSALADCSKLRKHAPSRNRPLRVHQSAASVASVVLPMPPIACSTMPRWRAEVALQVVKLPRAALESILRRTRKGAGLAVLRRRAEAAPAAGILGVGRADVAARAARRCRRPSLGSVKSTQSSSFNSGGSSSCSNLIGQQPVPLGIELVVLVDFPRDPFGVEGCLRADDDGEAAVADAGFALRLQLAGAALPLVEPDAQAVLFRRGRGPATRRGRSRCDCG